MKVEDFVSQMERIGIETVTGVPDSTLKQFCDYMNSEGSTKFAHYVPANEGAAVGIAVGTYLATGKPACIYMQNSGIGNIVNPVTSIANEEVYDIPMLFITGWRGEPEIKDEPQHKFMGKITTTMFDVLNIKYAVIGPDTDNDKLEEIFTRAKEQLEKNKQFSIIIKKETFEKRENSDYSNQYTLNRENVIGEIIKSIKKEDVVISTTGKISREVYEQSNKIKGSHGQDFLTVGGMGHASMIAFGYAKNRSDKRVYCIDGDGALLMHMGALAFLPSHACDNFVHVCINNMAHESVGGMPTGAAGIHFEKIAKAVGYKKVYHAENKQQLEECLSYISAENCLTFLEIMVSVDSRPDLSRPKETAVENKQNFMEYHR